MLSSTVVALMALMLVSGAASQSSLVGEATFYGGNVAGGHCSFTTYTIPSGLYGVALANWDDSSNCGACIAVTGPDGDVIKAMVSLINCNTRLELTEI